MRKGLLDVLPKNALEDLTAEDFRLLVNGCGEVNVQMLISFTSFNDESGMLLGSGPLTLAFLLRLTVITDSQFVRFGCNMINNHPNWIQQGKMRTSCCSSSAGFGPSWRR